MTGVTHRAEARLTAMSNGYALFAELAGKFADSDEELDGSSKQ
jgi:hypothetical protein